MTETQPPRPIDAIVAGYLGVDLTPGFASGRSAVPFADLFRPGKLIETQGLGVSLGGVVANTGLAMRRFGSRVELMGSVGRDALGDLAVALLDQAGVAAGIRRQERAGTAYGFVIAPPGSDRLFLEDPGCNRIFTAEDIDYSVVARSRIFHFGYPPLMQALWLDDGAELQALLARVREQGAAVSLDMSLPDPDSPAGKADWGAILERVLPLVDIFAPSIEELLFMLEPGGYARLSAAAGDVTGAIQADLVERLADRSLALGARVVLVKAGPRGAYLRAGDLAAVSARSALPISAGGCARGVWIPAQPVDASRFRNACGAGDCAVAGFLSALLHEEDLESAGRYAMLAGRDNLYGSDAVSGLRTWEEMAEDREVAL